MITVDFISVAIQNFRTFTGPAQKLRLQRPQAGLHFVKGRNEAEPELGANGAAKSTAFEAVCWCLYGQTSDGLATTDIVPWDGKAKPTIVTLRLRVNKEIHVVSRTARPNKLTLDKTVVSNEDIAALIGMSHLVFKHTCLLGQGVPLFFDLTARDKMAVLSAGINLDQWLVRSKLANEIAKQYTAEATDKYNRLEALDLALTQAEAQLKSVREQEADWFEEQKGKAKALKTRLTEAKKRLPILEKREADAILLEDGAGTEIKALEQQIERQRAAYSDANLAVAEKRLEIESAERQLAEVRANLKKLTTDSACPLCGSPIRPGGIKAHSSELKKRAMELSEAVTSGVPPRLTKVVTVTKRALDRSLEALEKYREELDGAQTTLRLVSPELAELKAVVRMLEQQQAEEEVNPHRETIAALRRSIKQTSAEFETVEREFKILERKAQRTGFWVKGFKDLRLFLIEELLQELEIATAALLPESGLRDWEVRYEIEKENTKGETTLGLNVTILSPANDKPVKWKCWSGGEANRLRVVSALALSEVLLRHAGVSPSLLVLDEPTRDLSVEGVQDLCEFLAYRAADLELDAYLIDHVARQSVHFIDTITVVKKSDNSSVIEDGGR